ncbi:hypothetical protein DFH09DRAFT_1359936 [Mycena vulgaris]|nr:hypothetical protein DFH09DRAFT_1359936 [Mycena vulgaris]
MFLAHSRFADKLDTNYVPSDAEMEQLRTLLMDPMDDSERSVRHWKRELTGTRLSWRPFDASPTTFLGKSFPTAHNALIDPGEAPMLLGRICKHWRSVAYSPPTIWSSLHIPSLMEEWDENLPVVPVPQSVERKLEQVVAAWLDRAAACPLSISFSRALNRPFISPDTVDHLIGASRRIRNFHIRGYSIDDVRSLLLRRGDDLPCLESIHITCHSDLNHFFTFWEGLPAFHAPNLRRISLTVYADALKLPLPWAQLTDLSLACLAEFVPPNEVQGGLDLNGVQEVLRRCPNLVCCYLGVTKLSAFTPGPILTLPHLTTLTLSQSFDSVQLLRCLVFPNLRYLGIGAPIVSLSSWDAENSAHELTLELTHGTDFSHDGLLDLLHLFPGISRLQVFGQDIREALLDSLRPTPQGTVCPVLTHMELGSCHFSDISLLDFIRARMTTERPLQSIKAHFQREVELDVVQELQTWISEGLHVDLRYSSLPWTFNAVQGILNAWEINIQLERSRRACRAAYDDVVETNLRERKYGATDEQEGQKGRVGRYSVNALYGDFIADSIAGGGQPPGATPPRDGDASEIDSCISIDPNASNKKWDGVVSGDIAPFKESACTMHVHQWYNENAGGGPFDDPQYSAIYSIEITMYDSGAIHKIGFFVEDGDYIQFSLGTLTFKSNDGSCSVDGWDHNSDRQMDCGFSCVWGVARTRPIG